MKFETVGDVRKRLRPGDPWYIYPLGYKSCSRWGIKEFKDTDDLPNSFELWYYTHDWADEITFQELQDISDLFETKNINFISDVEMGWYGTPNRLTRLVVTLEDNPPDYRK